jgi:hypothetical protein
MNFEEYTIMHPTAHHSPHWGYREEEEENVHAHIE